MAVSKLYAIIPIILLTSAASAGGLPEGKVTFRDRDFRYDRPQGYIEYLPAGYGGGERSPLLIDLTGKGEAGPGSAESLAKIQNNGVEGELRAKRWPKEFPFVVLSPQHRDVNTCPSGEEVDRFIQFAKERYHVDTDKIYLSGLSCGARAVADYLSKFGSRDVAAAIMMAGDATPAWEKQGCALPQNVALFGVHGGKDDKVPYGPDHDAFSSFAKCPNRRAVEFFTYPDATHTDPYTWGYARYDFDYFSRLLEFTKARPAVIRSTALAQTAR